MLMMQTYRLRSQGSSEDSPSSNSIQVIHHGYNYVMEVYATDKFSIPKWIEYMHYHNIN